jgi:glycine/D-amino acid oxidase-like deaminating enzyme
MLDNSVTASRVLLKGITMATAKIETISYWSASTTFPRFPKLAEPAEADVVVGGGGITGLTAAYLLAKAGKRVVVLERSRCAAIDTGHTSAHLTMVTDARLTELAKGFGRDHSQAVWDAGIAAIATIDDIVREHAIDAGFEWVDGYLHAPVGDAADEKEHLKADAALAGEPVDRAVRSRTEGADPRRMGLRQGERRLPVLPDS